MKTQHLISSFMLVGSAALSSLLLAAPRCSADEPKPGVAEATVAQSVFQMPGPGFNGRDPFYPNSGRFVREAVPVVSNTQSGSDLVLKGISGTASRPLAMINGVTFEVGEEREVRTGIARVRVRLMSVDLEGLKVTIAVGNETRELRLRSEESDSAATRSAKDGETAQLVVPRQF